MVRLLILEFGISFNNTMEKVFLTRCLEIEFNASHRSPLFLTSSAYGSDCKRNNNFTVKSSVGMIRI